MKRILTILMALYVVFYFNANSQGINFNLSTTTSGNKPIKNKETDKGKNSEKIADNNNNDKLPDLSFDSENCQIKVTPDKNAFTLDVKVRMLNNQVKNVDEGIKLGYYLTKGNTILESDKFLAEYILPDQICTGCWYSTSYNFNLAHSSFGLFEDGKYYVGLKVDHDNKLAETNEDNNSLVISTVVDYVVPEGVIEYNQYMVKQGESTKFLSENAGKILFGLGKFDYNFANKNNYVTELSLKDMTASIGSKEYGEELSFFVIFKRPLKDQFKLYRDQGLDKKTWPDDVYWVNLYYKLVIDNVDTVLSAYESENISFLDNTYSRWLTGKYATGSKLYLQQILLEEIYKLTPGKHQLKLLVYVKSTETGIEGSRIGPEIIADGEFALNITSEDKINHFKKYNSLKSPAKMKNTTLEGQMKQFLVDFYSESDEAISLSDIKYFAIIDAEWSYEKSFTGEILSRNIYTDALIQYKNGNCVSLVMCIGEDYIGSGSYTKPSFSVYESVECIPCEALK